MPSRKLAWNFLGFVSAVGGTFLGMETLRSHFELWRDGRGEFRFRLRAENGEPVLASEGYGDERDALDAIELIKGSAGCPVERLEDEEPEPKPKPAKRKSSKK